MAQTISAAVSTSTLRPVPFGKRTLTDKERRTRDNVIMEESMILWYFDPYTNGTLKSAPVVSINGHGPELRTDAGIYAYSRRAVWADREKAIQNGPPHEVYTYSRRSSNGNFLGA